ncbi:MAG: sugar phosphate isomerase/epimerase [Armatimonadota bacterium]
MSVRVPLALELYSVRDACAADMAGTLEKVAKMGYEGVEFAGYHGHEAKDLRLMLDDNGLTCCGSHLGITTLLGEELLKTAEFNYILGNPYLICPGLPGEYTASRDAWRDTADVFNEISGRLRMVNMWTGYHNHHTEFTPLDGEMPWDTFFGNTTYDVVMQLDSGNALLGGSHIGQFVDRYPYRALTVHLKPYSFKAAGDNPQDGYKPIIGDDDIPWMELFGQLETVGGVRWYIVEYESDLFPPLEAVEKCLQALKAMGK